MLHWPAPVRSAVFIDFENLPIPADALASWIAWLEDGRFHHGRRRRLLVRRVYWNSAAERNRDRYEAEGFDVVLCDKYANRKNGADIRMAVDIVEAIHTLPNLDEFILVTVDSDFVPVLQRLQARGKRSVILVDEQRPDLHTICRRHADVLIPLRRLAEARQYQRVPGRSEKIWGALVERTARRLGLPSAGEPTMQPAPVIPARAAAAEPPVQPPSPLPAPSGPAVLPAVTTPFGSPQDATPVRPETVTARGVVPPTRTLEAGTPQPAPALLTEPPRAGSRRLVVPPRAVEIVVRTMSKRTGDYVARSKVIRALRELPDFTVDGKSAYFGFGSYRDFMLEVAQSEPRLRFDESGHGFSVKLMADEPAPTRKSKQQSVDVDWPPEEDWPDEWRDSAPPDPWLEPGDWQSTVEAAEAAAAAEPAPAWDGSGRKLDGVAVPALRVVSNDR